MTDKQIVVQAEHAPQVVAPLTATAIRQQVNLIQEVMREVMQRDQHFGVVPGCGKKPTLLKPGAEKLAMTFRLRPIIDNDKDVAITDLDNGHREYRVYCHIYSMNGLEMATGIGCASTMESKYRYRNASDYEVTDQPIPRDSKERKAEYRKQGFGMKQVDGQWVWVKYKEGSKSENPDIADTYNTVLKMAKKRAFVDGILSATAASDIFTQDIEDLPVEEAHHEPVKPAQQASAPAAQEPAPAAQQSQEPAAEAPKKSGTISEAQAKRFFAIYRGAGKTDDEARAMLKEIYGIEKSSDIKKSDYEAICAWAQEPAAPEGY